ncbi:MAG: hypothetical protein Q7T35_08980, partial [Nitrosomonas sp.]|nr:hypothetical protein [Nitrosomonas sp.]
PFLFSHDSKLYIFYEVKTDFDVGEIWAQSMNADGNWYNHGCVLKESFHLSYPQVFTYNSSIYMVPESAASGNVLLYRSKLFPIKWERAKVLVDQPLLDPSILARPEGLFLFGTTRTDDLKLFFSPALDEEFIDIGKIISNCKSTSRNAGRPLDICNKLYRVAQDCERMYGEKIQVLEIQQLGLNDYSERVIMTDMFVNRSRWASEGYHHVSMVRLGDHVFVAVDGFTWDSWVNKASLIGLKLIGLLKKYVGA